MVSTLTCGVLIWSRRTPKPFSSCSRGVTWATGITPMIFCDRFLPFRRWAWLAAASLDTHTLFIIAWDLVNNSTLYRVQSNDFARAIYIELLGDPSLRLDPIAPPSHLTAVPNGSSVALNWSPSTDPVVGYHVYRAVSPAGPFTRLTSSLVSGTGFTDTSPPAGSPTYMVRAVALQTNPSGSYYDPSEGVFAQPSGSVTPPPISITAARNGNGVMLKWNSQSGIVYRVLAKTNFSQANWTDISGGITANSATTSWSDTSALPARFYRVASP